ncbi:Rha family transcriptional regulator [Ectopseudomonas mendocina]|uniref:Rha family transcriptional regulator n=1 Tax=Ectopseudomonas mendocina TaxID=300 RepID=UPI003F07D1AA
MTSLEIAYLTGKRHDNVMRDIRQMLAELHGKGRPPSREETVERPNPNGSASIKSIAFRLPRHELTPELNYALTDIKAEISAIVRLSGNVQHLFTPDAYTTTTLELTSDAAEPYTGVYAWYRDAKTDQQHKLTESDQANPRRFTHSTRARPARSGWSSASGSACRHKKPGTWPGF